MSRTKLRAKLLEMHREQTIASPLVLASAKRKYPGIWGSIRAALGFGTKQEDDSSSTEVFQNLPHPIKLVLQFEKEPPMPPLTIFEDFSGSKFDVYTDEYTFQGAYVINTQPVGPLTYECSCDYWSVVGAVVVQGGIG